MKRNSRTDSASTLASMGVADAENSLPRPPKWTELPDAFKAPPPTPLLNGLVYSESPAQFSDAQGPRRRPASGHARKRSMSTFLHVRSPLLDEVEDRLLQLAWDAEEVAREGFLVFRLAGRLAWLLGFARRWIVQLLSLLTFTMCLMPGFLSVGYEYFMSKRVKRGVRYGPNPRNVADLYFPPGWTPRAASNANDGELVGTDLDDQQKYPIAVFLSGGAWIIGYKAWGALLGLTLSSQGMIAVIPDYRNYPQARCSEMLRDVAKSLEWIEEEKDGWRGGGVHLVGQSAGGMLSASALLDGLARRLPAELRKSLRIDPLYKDDFEHTDEDSERYPSFPPPSSFIGISGPYNLPLHGLKFLEKGLDRRIVLDIFHNDLRGFSPLHRANAISKLFKLRGSDHIREDPELRSWLDIPVLLLHGTNDHSVPSSSSTSFASSLSQIFPNVSTKLYEGKTHTDPIIEDPFEGGEGVGADVCDWILGHSKTDGVGCVDVGKAAEKERRRVPAFLVRWARWWNPF